MKVYVIGMGVGNPALLTGEALDAAKAAGCSSARGVCWRRSPAPRRK